MKLRKLEKKDAPLMLEWMHDDSVTHFLNRNFNALTLDNAKAFIKASEDESEDFHRAIVSDTDEYMGTVSLKHIDWEEKNAEFAITIRKEAMHRGYSWYGMCEILKLAFDQLNLESVYWCVSEKNKRACRFYDKHGFHQSRDISAKILSRYEDTSDFRWYSVLKGDDFAGVLRNKNTIANCKVIDIKTIPTLNAGELSFFEGTHDFDFEIKRIYYISKVPEGTRRGYHAHKHLKQLLFCPYGKIQLVLEDKDKREEITLSDPSVGVVIDHPVWREMLWLEKNSVLCVAASDFYDENDYIRNYDDFKRYISK